VAWLLLGYSSPKLRPINVFFTPKPLSDPIPPLRLSCPDKLNEKTKKKSGKRYLQCIDFFFN
jgi:hypothetical protein